MKILTLLLSFLLIGCTTTVPVVAKFPDTTKTLTEKCAPLKKIESENVSIVDLHKTVVENYTQYYECSLKVDGWNEWYKQQSEIFNKVSK